MATPRNGAYTHKSSEYGSFKDSLRAPIHRWFTYPAGYSYKFVESEIRNATWTSDIGSWIRLLEREPHQLLPK